MEQIITQPNCNKTDNDPISLLFGTYQTHTDTGKLFRRWLQSCRIWCHSLVERYKVKESHSRRWRQYITPKQAYVPQTEACHIPAGHDLTNSIHQHVNLKSQTVSPSLL